MNTNSITVRRASNQADLDLMINELMPRSFTDPTDLDDPENIKEYHELGLAVTHLVQLDGKPIGFTLNRVHPHLEPAYCPYMGVNPEHRNKGYGSTAFPMILKDLGVPYVLFDFEDPDRMEGVYPDEPLEQVIARCNRRFAYWERLGCRIVNDSRIQYCRFASDDPTEIQAYDCLAVCPADIKNPLWADVFSQDGSMMSMVALRKFYVEIFQLEGMNPSQVATERELSEKYPAIKDYLTRWQYRFEHGEATHAQLHR